MSVKECAIQDIKEDLKKQEKSFIGFIQSLDPIMDDLVNSHIKAQEEKGMFKYYDKSNSRLEARCLYDSGKITFLSYTKYYEKKRKDT